MLFGLDPGTQAYYIEYLRYCFLVLSVRSRYYRPSKILRQRAIISRFKAQCPDIRLSTDGRHVN